MHGPRKFRPYLLCNNISEMHAESKNAIQSLIWRCICLSIMIIKTKTEEVLHTKIIGFTYPYDVCGLIILQNTMGTKNAQLLIAAMQKNLHTSGENKLNANKSGRNFLRLSFAVSGPHTLGCAHRRAR